VLGLLWLLFTRTRWGTLVRAATQDREMVGALGVNQAWLFTAVFALGAALAGLGGALQLPREPANLEMDLNTIGAAFVVVVVGGMGSIPGAFVAALLVSEIKAVCIWLGLVHVLGFDISFSKLTLVAEFLVMAVVLVVRPWGLMGKPQAAPRVMGEAELPIRPADRTALGVAALVLALLSLPAVSSGDAYAVVLAIDLLVASCLPPACTSSWGRRACIPSVMRPTSAWAPTARRCWCASWAADGGGAGGGPARGRPGRAARGLVLRAPVGRVPGHADAGVRADRLGHVYQWDAFTGGSNGLTGVWPAPWLAAKQAYYYLTLAVVLLALWTLRRCCSRPWLCHARGRDSPLRADAIGIDVKRQQWAAFAIAGGFAGVAGRCSRFPRAASRPRRWAWASRWTAW
jgi:branched-chain amino acid transport system permease protein